MTDYSIKPDKFPECEVCGELIEGGDMTKRIGCDYCGRMFGPCCNSQEDGACVECAK